jgi:hypothetical protein
MFAVKVVCPSIHTAHRSRAPRRSNQSRCSLNATQLPRPPVPRPRECCLYPMEKGVVAANGGGMGFAREQLQLGLTGSTILFVAGDRGCVAGDAVARTPTRRDNYSL